MLSTGRMACKASRDGKSSGEGKMFNISWPIKGSGQAWNENMLEVTNDI